MDLKTFVAETLIQIQEGVQVAIDRRMAADKNCGAINPHFGKFEQDTEKIVERVQFDVAVTAVDSAEGELKGGLKVWSLELGGKGSKTSENSVVSRIQFAVRILPPTTQITLDRDAHNQAAVSRAPKSYGT